ncbi:MAG: tyrosine-type recombinase/integrase [Cyclobacteriaceae bacterium]
MLESFLKYIEYEKRYSQHTIISYRSDLDKFLQFVNKEYQTNQIQEVNHAVIRSWIIFLSESGMGARSINRKIASLKSYFKFLLKREIIEENPTQRLKPLKVEKKLPSFVRESEMDQMLNHFQFSEDFGGNRDRLVIELLYGTGIRLSELINLRKTDVNLFENHIKVLGKRNKERIIPISAFIVKLIKEYAQKVALQMEEANETKYLILTDKGDQTYPVFIYRLIKKYLEQFSHSDKKSPHVLRHTFATHLLNKGADLNAVKELLGHTSLAATQVYTHNSLDKLKKVFDQAHPKA